MQLVADLHIHSHYSRATSKNLNFEHLWKWAQLKGVHVVGTGDIAHPGWLAEMREKLEPAEEGLFRLKDEVAAAVQEKTPPACRGTVRFMLAGEISNIYKRHDRVRKIHNVVFAPSLEAVANIQAELEKIGNIRADGRPILGLDSRDLLEIVLEVDPRCRLIPAHIWTPWFSLLGSKSGFDSVEECFDDLTPHIFALETGLSSDPPMNWRISALDRYTLVSNSDAHSPQKLAREATLFDTDLAYDALFTAMQSGDPATFKGTVEFFPQEGKYHYDGHRKCSVCWDPQTTLAHDGLCPRCGKPVTVGVMHRVETLADRPVGARPPRPHPFHSLIPLPEVLSEVHGVGPNSKRVQREYWKLLDRLGPELVILQDIPLEEIAAVGGTLLAEGIGRMRRGEVTADAGYDGEYGVIRLFRDEADRLSSFQMGLFGAGRGAGTVMETPEPYHSRSAPPAVPENGPETSTAPPLEQPQDSLSDTPEAPPQHPITPASHPQSTDEWLARLNPEQREAVQCIDAPLVIVAGPGTGKTRTLTVRIAYLIRAQGVAPDSILAITFTNKAAEEMQERLTGLLGADVAERITIRTFHAFGARILREHGAAIGLSPDFTILNDDDRRLLLRQACPELKPKEIDAALESISTAKNRLDPAPDDIPGDLPRGPSPGDIPRASSTAPSPTPGDLPSGHRPEGIPRASSTVPSPTPGDLPRGPSPEDIHSPEDIPRASSTVPSPTWGGLGRGAGRGGIHQRYADALRQSQALDFDDLIFQTVRLFESRPDVLQAVQERFRWISVDEYQDVNFAQNRLLRLLTADGANLCVIGDPDQAIYGFRGADRRYFLSFHQDYPGAKTLHLNRNYRSTQLILDAARQVIAQNPDREALQIWSDFAAQVKLDVYRAPTDKAEAEYVVHQIEQMVGGTSYFSLDSGRVDDHAPPVERTFGDFAVLYRLGAQSRLLVEAFARSGIPFQVVGQTPLYAQKGVREVLAHLWLLHNPRSRVHWERVLREGRGALPPDGLARLWTLMGEGTGSLPERLQPAVAASGLTGAQRARLAALAAFWRGLTADGAPLPVSQLVEQVHRFVAEQSGAPPGEAEAERIQQLRRRAAPFGPRLADFLEAMALQRETDLYDPRADRVTLMTLHAAKGLEFPVVFVVGCEEGLLPYLPQNRDIDRDADRDIDTDRDIDVEEERRLFYVGMTRAQQKLVLTHARTRFLFGQRVQNPVSRFVNDIEKALVEMQEAQRRARPQQPEGVQLRLF